MTRSIALTVLLAVLVCSCARGSPTQGAADAKPAAAAPAPTSSQAAGPQQSAQSATAPEIDTAQAAAAQESAGDEPEEDRSQARSDAGLERLAQLPADQQLPGGRWKPGVNYDPLVPSQPTNVSPGKVEVVEVFWLGCPHCYALEPYLQSWLKNKPAYVEFVRVPVMWGPVHRAHAHLFYTLMALNHPELVQQAFDTIQQKHEMLAAPSEEETLRQQQNFAKNFGISPEDYTKAYNSFTVNSNLQRAEQLTQRYHVEGVPVFVIDGKYTTDVARAGSQSNLIALIDDLSAAERRH
ncbi:MAG TPA: thiol:disulfide interchange protein DsbA/DsbL [Steroidobacteraceae bacterium]|nr:thiol:disulfide interchange protein DsbA/DsbL [Steroidobacteraceae bacterium]